MTERERLVLVVDDDEDFAAAACAVLETEGLVVARANGAEEALSLAARRVPDLLITDLMMGRLDDGFLLAGRVRELPGCAHVPVMIVTAAVARRGFDFRPRGAADLAAMGAQAFLEKPVVPEKLASRVRELLVAAGGQAPQG